MLQWADTWKDLQSVMRSEGRRGDDRTLSLTWDIKERSRGGTNAQREWKQREENWSLVGILSPWEEGGEVREGTSVTVIEGTGHSGPWLHSERR